ncbi:MAG: cysteine desulfurase NifS [Clostridia bacterium]|nr:cysteine desulfurase NifS [Clostridia bacterium]
MHVYLDNAATTKVLPEVIEAMIPYYSEFYGNPSSFHSFARDAHKGLDDARRTVARCLNAADPAEIYFTGGGSEGDNMILRGITYAYRKKGNHIITSKIEHHAILHTLQELANKGLAEVTYLDVDENGLVDPEAVRAAIRPETILVSVMMANNEVGTIEPIKEIGAVCHAAGVLFHTDAVQAVGHIPVDVQDMNIDLLTLTAHKFHGPKGVGAVYIKKGVRVPAMITGGGQENKKRAGTENVPGIVGLAKALEIQTENLEANMQKMTALRDKLIAGVEERIPTVHLNGHRTQRLPNNVNFGIRYIESESILLMLDLQGVAASSGSACTSGSLDPSHVLLAMGISHEAANGSLRLTLSEFTTEEEIDYVLEILPPIVQRLRDMSPIYPKGGVE